MATRVKAFICTARSSGLTSTSRDHLDHRVGPEAHPGAYPQFAAAALDPHDAPHELGHLRIGHREPHSGGALHLVEALVDRADQFRGYLVDQGHAPTVASTTSCASYAQSLASCGASPASSDVGRAAASTGTPTPRDDGRAGAHVVRSAPLSQSLPILGADGRAATAL